MLCCSTLVYWLFNSPHVATKSTLKQCLLQHFVTPGAENVKISFQTCCEEMRKQLVCIMQQILSDEDNKSNWFHPHMFNLNCTLCQSQTVEPTFVPQFFLTASTTSCSSSSSFCESSGLVWTGIRTRSFTTATHRYRMQKPEHGQTKKEEIVTETTVQYLRLDS